MSISSDQVNIFPINVFFFLYLSRSKNLRKKENLQKNNTEHIAKYSVLQKQFDSDCAF